MDQNECEISDTGANRPSVATALGYLLCEPSASVQNKQRTHGQESGGVPSGHASNSVNMVMQKAAPPQAQPVHGVTEPKLEEVVLGVSVGAM